MSADNAVTAPGSEPSTAAVIAMVELLEPLALAELERALRLTLQPRTSAGDRLAADLGFVSRLIAEIGGSRIVPRLTYDARRSTEAPSSPDSRRLVERYGSWPRVCRAAAVLLPNRGVTTASAYPSVLRGRRRIRQYTREEITQAVRRCAMELGRVPTSHVYEFWNLDAKRQARAAGVDLPRLPAVETIYRSYKEWPKAIAAAGLTEAELAHARVTRLLRLAHLDVLPVAPLEALASADLTELSKVGIDPARRAFLAKHGLAQISLGEASKLARLLGGSLDWLAGVDSQPGTPSTADLVFDPAAMERVIAQGSISATDLRGRLELGVGPWRRLRSGKREPMLYELAVIAQAGGSRIADLVETV